MVLIAVFTAVIVFTIGVNARLFLTEKEEHQERDYLAMKIKDELILKENVFAIIIPELYRENFESIIRDDIKTIIIGCEGGFSKKEREKFNLENIVGFNSNLILRSETAILSAGAKILL